MDLPDFLKHYGLLLAVGGWLLFRWIKARRLVARIPELQRRGAVFIDVRSSQEFLSGHAALTLNIPLQELAHRLGEIPTDRPVVLCCASGTRSGLACSTLRRRGYREVHNAGSWRHLMSRS